MAVIGILLVAEILKQVGLYVPLRDLGRLIGHPIQILNDIVKVLGAVESGLLLGQLPLRPQLEEGMILTMFLIASCD
jgi:hypothetical protein